MISLKLTLHTCLSTLSKLLGMLNKKINRSLIIREQEMKETKSLSMTLGLSEVLDSIRPSLSTEKELALTVER